jgi:hypothetical protein
MNKWTTYVKDALKVNQQQRKLILQAEMENKQNNKEVKLELFKPISTVSTSTSISIPPSTSTPSETSTPELASTSGSRPPICRHLTIPVDTSVSDSEFEFSQSPMTPMMLIGADGSIIEDQLPQHITIHLDPTSLPPTPPKRSWFVRFCSIFCCCCMSSQQTQIETKQRIKKEIELEQTMK